MVHSTLHFGKFGILPISKLCDNYQGNKLLFSEAHQVWRTHDSCLSIQEDQRDGSRKTNITWWLKDHFLLLLFPFSKFTKTVYSEGCRIGRWELICNKYLVCLMIKFKGTEVTTHAGTHTTYFGVATPEKCVYLGPWISFVMKAPGSQAAGEMWDL